MNWAEESEKPPSFLTKTETQRLNWRKPANRTRHQNRKTAIFKSENRKTESKIGQIRKTENPNAPLLTVMEKISRIGHFDDLSNEFKIIQLVNYICSEKNFQ